MRGGGGGGGGGHAGGGGGGGRLAATLRAPVLEGLTSLIGTPLRYLIQTSASEHQI